MADDERPVERLYQKLRVLVGQALCRVGGHDYQWNVTMGPDPLNWQECTRCGHVESEFRHHYEAYQEGGTDA